MTKKKQEFLEGDYASNQLKFEIDALIKQASRGEITEADVFDQVEDLVVCTIMQGMDEAFKPLYETNKKMLVNVLAKLCEAMAHRGMHLDTYYKDADLEVK